MKEKLLKAIDLAKNAGYCQYVVDGQPCCVIGQLARLEGLEMSWFDGRSNNISIDYYNDLNSQLPYDLELLIQLQGIWDMIGLDEEELREQMRKVVDVYFP